MIPHQKTIGRAGAGKSRKMIADVLKMAEQGLKIIVVVFNKKLQTELASAIYHENVTVQTFHSIAYRQVGKKAGYPTSYSSVKKLMPSLSTKEATVLSKLFAMFTQSKSDYKEFSERLFAEEQVRTYAQTIKSLKSPEQLAMMLQEIMESYEYESTHDAYLKEYQLSKPSIPYDVVVIDEYQDYSELMIDVIHSYNKPTLIYGDPDQKIYGFRFATGDFNMDFEITKLPETNRCPSNITNLANVFLGMLGDELMISNIPDGNIYEYDNFPVIKENSTMISNYNLIAIEAILFYGHRVNLDVHIDIKMDKLKEMWNFVNKRPDVPAWMKRFNSVDHLVKFYHETENINGLTMIKCALLIKNWTKFEDMINHFDEDQPTLTLTNVFLSKGLEWDNVIIAKDFTDFETTSYNKMTYDSVRFLYTAITRSKKNLWIPAFLNKMEVNPICSFLEDTGDMIKQKENELIMRSSKTCGSCKETKYEDGELDVDQMKTGGTVSCGGLELNVKSVTSFSKNDSGLYFAQQMDRANKEDGVRDVNGGGDTANADRYMESKIFGTPIRDLELRDKADTYFLNDKDIAEIGMRSFGEFSL